MSILGLQNMDNKKEVQVYKNKKLNAADFDNFTLNDYQVYINLLGKIGGVDNQGNYLPPEKLKREHILTAKEFSENFNTDIKHCYRAIKEAVNKLMKTDIKIERTVGNGYKRINVCSQAEYNNHKGSITVRFTEEIMPFLAQVTEKFTLYNLKEVSQFRSIYSLRLYELLQDFKDTGYMILSIKKLKEFFAIGDKFKLYADLKRKTFGHAVEEINATYKMNLKFEEIKEGRKVTTLKFTFNKTKIDKRYNNQTGKYTNEYTKPEVITRSKKSVTSNDVLDGQLSFEDSKQDNQHISSTLGKWL